MHSAAAFELRITSNVAIHVDRGRASTRATRVAMVLAARRRRHFAGVTTIIGTAGIRIDRTITLGMLRLAFADERLLTFAQTTCHTIELGRVTIRHALRTAGAGHGVGARGASRRGAATRATRNEFDGRALSIATAGRDDFAIRESCVFGDELTALGGHIERHCRRRCEQHGGQSKERESEFTEVCHEVCPYWVMSKNTNRVDHEVHGSHTTARTRYGRVYFAKLHGSQANCFEDGTKGWREWRHATCRHVTITKRLNPPSWRVPRLKRRNLRRRFACRRDRRALRRGSNRARHRVRWWVSCSWARTPGRWI